MSYNKKQFYMNTPSGDSILTEIFQENKSVTILLGGNNRIDLDLDSAFELADLLILIANEGRFPNEKY
tara:strand:+ start:11159 stop:11362 length:204 start_codon:yes stop_codon:yes gene_type:complete